VSINPKYEIDAVKSQETVAQDGSPHLKRRESARIQHPLSPCKALPWGSAPNWAMSGRAPFFQGLESVQKGEQASRRLAREVNACWCLRCGRLQYP